MKEQIEQLALKWLSFRTNIDALRGQYELEVLVWFNSQAGGFTAEFYDANTGKTINENWFLTIPMVNKLLQGNNPKRVENEYRKRNQNPETK
jgi:hypothetical protein